MESAKYTCPCCGHQVFSNPPGSFELCPICFWEDDELQLREPNYAGGANPPSLIECQANYAKFGACEERFVKDVRLPKPDEPLDPAWRNATSADVLLWSSDPAGPSASSNSLEHTYYWLRLPSDSGPS